MTRDDAVRFLTPKWTVVRESRIANADELTLNTGQVVQVYDDGTFHVSGKGWKDINRHLQECQWPPYAVIRAGEIRKTLVELPAAHQKYFSEGLRCIQFAQAPKAAIVLGWTGFMDVFHQRLLHDLKAVNQALAKRFPKIYADGKGSIVGLDDIRVLADWQTLALGLEMAFYKKHVHTQLNAMRDQRNNCAHVEEFEITVDMALGFYASLVQYLKYIRL